MIYQEHIHPFLNHHEQKIDEFIGSAHDRARSAGLQYLKQAIEFVRVKVLNLPPSQQASPPPTSSGTYAQSLLSRFNLPSARDGFAAPASDFYGLVSSALGQAMAGGGTKDIQAEEMSASGTLIPPNISSNADKMNYIASQRDRLRVLMSAFDMEANKMSSSRDGGIESDVERRMRDIDSGLKKSKSELEFEPIEHEGTEFERQGRSASGGGSWMPWGWAGGQQPEGSSSGVDIHH